MNPHSPKSHLQDGSRATTHSSPSYNEEPLAAIRLEEAFDPKLVLKRHLSLRSVLSTGPSFAERYEAAIGAASEFRSIGAGTCGRVFEVPGTCNVFKIENFNSDWLWNDYLMHTEISEAFSLMGQAFTDIHVPKVHYFVSRDDKVWWDQNIARFPKQFRTPSSVLCSERILPLAKPIRESLIDQYCPKHLVDEIKNSKSNKDCLVRLYLGKRRRPQPSKFFTLRNFCLYLDQMEELELDIIHIAHLMAEALALMHWRALIDANDVEFILGSAPERVAIPAVLARPLTSQEIRDRPKHSSTWDSHIESFKGRITHLWLIDFNRCDKLTPDNAGVEKAVRAFFCNDPYYPRPHAILAKDQRLWASFRDRYLATSRICVDAHIQDLPSRFIDAVVEEERKHTAKKRETRKSEA